MGTIQPREIILVYAPRVIITLKTGNFNSPSASGQGPAAAVITPVGRLSACRRHEDLEPVLYSSLPTLSAHSTFRHHTRGSGSSRWQQAVRIRSRHCHKPRFSPPPECINSESIIMQPYGFKALVLAEFWATPTPALARFMPGHDPRIGVTDDGLNPNNINIQITPSHHPLRPTTTFAVPCCTSGSTTFNLECSRLSSTVYDMGLSCSVSTSPLSLNYYHCIHPLRLYCYVMTHIIA